MNWQELINKGADFICRMGQNPDDFSESQLASMGHETDTYGCYIRKSLLEGISLSELMTCQELWESWGQE
jgi:hypothetical protein